MGQRLDLHEILTAITDRAYFQPPENIQMTFPCIVYEIDGGTSEHADNRPYRRTKRYQVTVIDRNPDSDLYDQVWELSSCTFERFFTADQLNHWVFNLSF